MKAQDGIVVGVRNLVKQYPGVRAVDEISFEVHQGEIFGMVGPNGAGKTTTIECVEGLRQPDSGSIEVLGLDPQRRTPAHEQQDGMDYVPTHPAVLKNTRRLRKPAPNLNLYSSITS